MDYTLKKSLGQHFLIDETVCIQIMEAIGQFPVKQLLEVGPGGGALTQHLLMLPNSQLLCVELDKEKVVYLTKKYPALKGKIINEDFLQLNRPFEGQFTVVGNFPYNISSQILFRMIDWRDHLEGMVGMFQKEVAQRASAGPGSKIYGLTSVLLQAFFKVDYLFEVHENCFTPPPKVKSAVIQLTPLEEPVHLYSPEKFFRLVKAGFGQRRKTLRNAVKAYFLPEVLEDPIFNKRAEQLSVADFAHLTFRMT